jgi:TRAP-type C4-dicarboxylate transport system permease small subunit
MSFSFNSLKRIINLEVIITITFVVFFISILIGIIARQLGISVIWTENLATFANIWTTFIGASILVKKFSHIRLNIFDGYLKRNSSVWNIYIIFFNLIILLISIILAYGALQIAITQYESNTYIFTLGIRASYEFLSMVIGFSLAAFFSLAEIIKRIITFIGSL